MAQTFTPGPNTIVQADHLGATAYAVVEGEDGDLLAVGCLKGDALLYAAAPELYHYLELALAVLDRANVAWGGESVANAVLAKASGEQVLA
jgi:hypothetical protein